MIRIANDLRRRSGDVFRWRAQLGTDERFMVPAAYTPKRQYAALRGIVLLPSRSAHRKVHTQMSFDDESGADIAGWTLERRLFAWTRMLVNVFVASAPRGVPWFSVTRSARLAHDRAQA